MPLRRYLGVRLAGRDLAVDAAAVAGVLPGHDFTAIAHPCPWIRGIARLENRDLVVVDLAALHGWGRSRQAAIVILHLAGQRAGFFTDRISGFVEPLRRQPQPGFLHTTGRSRILITPEEVLHAAGGALASLTGAVSIPVALS